MIYGSKNSIYYEKYILLFKLSIILKLNGQKMASKKEWIFFILEQIKGKD